MRANPPVRDHTRDVNATVRGSRGGLPPTAGHLYNPSIVKPGRNPVTQTRRKNRIYFTGSISPDNVLYHTLLQERSKMFFMVEQMYQVPESELYNFTETLSRLDDIIERLSGRGFAMPHNRVSVYRQNIRKMLGTQEHGRRVKSSGATSTLMNL